MRRFKLHGSTSRRGTTAVEMAIVLGLLMLLVIGLMQFAWLFFSAHAMQTASDRGARALAVQGLDGSESSDRTAAELSSMFGAHADDIEITVSQPNNDRVIQVETPTSNAWLSWGDAFGLLDGITSVNAESRMRDEESY